MADPVESARGGGPTRPVESAPPPPPPAADEEPHGPAPATFLVASAAIILLALGLRLAAIGEESLWGDESHTLITAGKATLAEVIATSRREVNHPPLYFLLMHVWIGSFGDGDVSVRLPSALAGVAAVGGMILLAGSLRPRRPWLALIAGVMAATSPFLIYYSQEARNYSLLVAVEIFALWGILPGVGVRARKGSGHPTAGATGAPAPGGARRPESSGPQAPDAEGLPARGAWRARPGWVRRWGLPLARVLAVLAAAIIHHYGLLLCGWAAIVMLIRIARQRRERPWPDLTALILLVAATAPLALVAMGDLRRGEGLSWMPERLVIGDLLDVVGAQVWGPVFAAVPRPLAFTALAVFCAALAAAVGAMAWRLVRRIDGGWEGPLLLAAGLLFVAPVAISMALRPVIWYGSRYLIVAVPVMLLILVRALEVRWLRHLVASSLVLMLACSAFYLSDLYRYRQKRQWDVAAARLDAESSPGEAIAVIPSRLAPLVERYLHAPLKVVDDSALFLPDGPGRLWLLATGDLRAEVIGRTDYRVTGYEVITGRSPAAIHIHHLERRAAH